MKIPLSVLAEGSTARHSDTQAPSHESWQHKAQDIWEKFQQVAYSKVIADNWFVKFTFTVVTILKAKLILVFTHAVPTHKKTHQKSQLLRINRQP
jgi:hypothetical protein